MSAVPGSIPGGLKRSFAELLASRARKADRKAEYSSKRIQEAAVYLLSCHQDVNQFLLEIEDPACKKICNGKNSDCKHPLKSALLPESFVGSTLRDQALHLGIPADVLGARAAVSNIQQICHNVGNNMEEVWLSQDQRDRLTAFLKTLKVLKTENCFRCSVFLKEVWQQPRPPVLEVVWHLHSMDIVDIEEILESSTDMSSAVDWFCTEMQALCLRMENSSDDHEFVEQIISNLLAVLIGRAFCHSASSEKNLEQSEMAKISRSILNAMLSWLLDAVVEAGSGQSYKPGVERHWLIAYKVSRYRAHMIPESLEEFFLHTLSQTLTYKPKLKVSDAIRFQENWSFVKTCPLLTDLYRKLFVLLNAEKLTSHVQSILDTQEVNWHHVLSFISCLVIFQSEAQHLVKGLLSRLLSQAFETYELEYLITAFLIARQAALEGPAAFMSYTEWFKVTFGSPSSHQSSSKKSLVFLLKFLSDLVPFETPQYLKVHILHSPFVPTKFRALLMEYITLAKTRLADMKVSIEDMGLYEDLSVGSDKDQPQAQQDVEKAVKIFENTGKIPASVMEASIFRRPYFTSRFLPALLTPRVLPKVPDSLMLLIDALKRADKIPANVLSSYLDACELQRHRKLEGNENMDVSLNTEPMARLQAALWELRPYVMHSKPYDEISSQVAVISDRLRAVMASVNPSTIPVTSDTLFSCSIEELEPQELTVSDLLLTSFCQCVLAAFSTNPPDRQGPWPTLYVKMLFGHRRALFALLTRMLQLLCHQAPHLKDSHVVGLAAFSVHLHECRMSLEPSGSDVPLLDKFWKSLLNPQCSGSLPVVLRFCTAAISYAYCRFSFTSTDTCSNSLPPLFMCKLQHLLPRLVPETRREGMVEGMEETDTPIVFSALSHPSPAWKEAALSLWRQTRVQELFKKDLFQLSFRDWLLWEMSLNPGVDPLSDMERQDYQRWAVNQFFLPKTSTIGGCGNNVEKACATIVDAILDFNTGCEIDSGSYPSNGCSGLSGILSRLQELVCDILCIKGKNIQVDFLLDAFHQKLAKDSNSLETGAQLGRQCKLAMCCRIVLGLPSSLLVRPYSVRGFTTLKADDFFQFVSKHLKNISQRGYALLYDLTAHFFRGLLSSSAQCEDPEEAVNSVLSSAYTHCPIVMTSAALWWPQLDAAIKYQWNCLYEADLPKEIETLQEMQADVDRFLSQGAALPLTKTTWLSAAFLHFTIRRNKVPQQRLTELLSSFSSKSVQMLDCLLFFLIMDLIPQTLKGEAEHKMALEHCIQTIQCLEEKGGSWLTTFQRKSEIYKCHLHQFVSEEFLKLLPLAFFSLAAHLPVESMVNQQDFLPISLEMYTQLFQLFLDGSPLLDPLQADPQSVFSMGRQFLLRCILKSPHTSAVFRSRLPQIIESWDEKDPELAGMLKNLLQSFEDDCMYDEPDLF